MQNTYAIIAGGKVQNLVLWDGDEEQWQPPASTQAVLVPEDAFVTIGTAYDGEQFAEPMPAPDPTPEQNTVMRDNLLAGAAVRIAPLQDAVDLDEATDEELAQLTAWKRYRVDLNRVDLNSPQWPTAPDTSSAQ